MYEFEVDLRDASTGRSFSKKMSACGLGFVRLFLIFLRLTDCSQCCKLQFLFVVVAFVELATAQTYTVDGTGENNCGLALATEYSCRLDDGSNFGENFAPFIDTNAAGQFQLETMSLMVSQFCVGNYRVFINGVEVATSSSSGTCQCVSAVYEATRSLSWSHLPFVLLTLLEGRMISPSLRLAHPTLACVSTALK